MKLTILGSSGGYPEPGRACSGYLVQSESTRIWVDAGTGTLDALLRIEPFGALDGILISHLHPDHWTDLPIALHRLAVINGGKVEKPIPVYGPADWPRGTGVADQWFSRDQSVYVPHVLDATTRIQINDLRITFAEVEHGMPVFAMRFTDGASTVTYSADTSPCDALIEIARDADLFLCEATLPTGKETAISMNAEQAGQVASEAMAKQLVLTHLLPDVDPDASCEAAARRFSGHVDYARPGRVFEVGSSM